MIDINIGKISPQAVDIEEAVLGALILEPDTIISIEHFLKPEVFYNHKHQIITEAIIEMRISGERIDLLTVVNKLKTKQKLEEVGGAYYLAELTNKISNAINIEYYYRIIYEKYIAREMITVGGEIYRMSYNDDTDVFELLDKNIEVLDKIRQGVAATGEKRMSTLMSEHSKRLEKLTEMAINGQYSGIETPIYKLTKVMRGWQPSDLIVIAGRPGMGKTAFMMESIRRACEQNKSVLCFSLEMSGVQLINRLLQGFGMSERELKDGEMTEASWIKYQKYLGVISNWKLHIDDTGGVDLNYIKAVCNRINKKQGLDFVLIDYLQYMDIGSNKNATTDEKIGEVTRTLKAIAKNLDVPVVLLSQLNREVEKRDNKVPRLSDLRASGNIEQDADVVLFLYRPAYYGIKENEAGESTENYLEIINAKNRHGEPNGIYKAETNESLTRIMDYKVNEFTND